MAAKRKKKKTPPRISHTASELNAVILLAESINKLANKGWLRKEEKERLRGLLEQWDALPKRVRQLAVRKRH